jgi:3-oxoisoapionate decarboxylase
LKRYSSEWMGVCLDTGNNLALLDDPYQMVEKLAPFAFSTHIKDMGVAASNEGFLLSEVVLGDGFLDMKRIVETIRRHQPKVRLQLEMITRDPLSIPCLTDKYWATFPDRNGLFLARTLALVKQSERGKLPVMTGLTPGAAKTAEAENVKKCLAYARQKLALG